jgi:divalent metal cation (Fe/Co/Zn/Cd) transporter
VIKVVKGIFKIIIIFLAFFFVINLAEHLFDMEFESYTIVIIFIVVASSSGMFNYKKRK